ncbi:hypothetical protein IGI04_026234 [Brassica rapa subsp. trilocularis]|uniref:Uncharacterized protein n=1 Tax=Brassica rapa subsp. trilocularis TaxID=1813537 RepID=A0ABQ7KVP6_BRACM|nr:hypothetical protein IGI04_026234 [Brassica rapa subsp. trilocularis]
MTGVSFHETTKAIQMDDEWWNDRIQQIPDAAKLRAHPLTDIDRLDQLFGGKHISTDDGYYPGSGVDQNTESETVTENEHDTVNLEDDSDAPSRNQNETPSSYNQSSKRVYGNTSRSSSSARKRGTPKVSYDFVTNEAYMKRTELYEQAQDNKLECAIASLQTLPGLQYDSSLYWGAVTVLQSNETHARVYLTLPDDDARIKYLERMTGIDREAE